MRRAPGSRLAHRPWRRPRHGLSGGARRRATIPVPGSSGAAMKSIIAGVLALWFVAVFLLGAARAIARSAGPPPVPILIAATAPVLAFLGAYWGWPAFRAYVLSFDLLLAA